MATQTAANDTAKELVMENVISTAVQIPGVKVDRNKFLTEQFASSDYPIRDILELGPVEAGVTREELSKLSYKLIFIRTGQSSLASFVAGIPGGLAMAATIPADILQFFGMALRLAQEISYLYGAKDLWIDGKLNDERVRNQLILYCGVMFGVDLAVSGLRVLTTQIAKTTLKKLPQKALTKTFWYPIIKKIGQAISVKITKATVAQGVSKAIPIVGGVISGGLNFASMMPMANRLNEEFDKSTFDYTQSEFESDIIIVEQAQTVDVLEVEATPNKADEIKAKVTDGFKSIGDKTAGIFGKLGKKPEKDESKQSAEPVENPIEKIKEYKELLDLGILTQEEFDKKKKELLDL